MSALSVAAKRKPRGLAALATNPEPAPAGTGGLRCLHRLHGRRLAPWLVRTAPTSWPPARPSAPSAASRHSTPSSAAAAKVFIPHTHVANVVLFVGLMATTLLFRGAFCGWICPFGTLQEWTYRLSGWLQKRIPGLAASVKAIKSRFNSKPAMSNGRPAEPSLGQRLDRWLRFLKYGLLAWIIWGTIIYGKMVFRDIDPWAALVNFTEEFAVGGLVVLIVVLRSLALRGTRLVPLRLPAGRHRRHRRQAEPGAHPARRVGLLRLLAL